MRPRDDLTLVILAFTLGVMIYHLITLLNPNNEIHDMQVEAVMYECAHWNVYGEFDWNGPNIDGLVLIEKDVK